MSETRSPMRFEQVYRTITERLAAGDYRPGERISATIFAKSLGVSTTPVREALSRLAGRDVVEERYREGFYLASLSSSAIADLYTLHGLSIDLALQRWTSVKAFRPHRDLWTLFDRIVVQTGDVALIGVERYLGGRLRMIRRYERMIIADMASIGHELGKALKVDEIAQARTASREFHDRCLADTARLGVLYANTR